MKSVNSFSKLKESLVCVRQQESTVILSHSCLRRALVSSLKSTFARSLNSRDFRACKVIRVRACCVKISSSSSGSVAKLLYPCARNVTNDLNMPATVAAVVDKQTTQYGLISRAVANVKKLELKKRTAEQIQTRLEILDDNWKKFQENHDLLSSLKAEERSVLPYFTDHLYEQCEEIYADQKSELLSYLNQLKSKIGQSVSTASSAQSSSRATTSRKLPQLNVPSFSGSYREWRPFRDLFSAMIVKNTEILDVEKLQYLNMSVLSCRRDRLSSLFTCALPCCLTDIG